MEEVVADPESKVVKGQLSDLIFETTLGSKYVFPDFDTVEAVKLVKSFPEPLRLSQLTLINASGACLVVPTRTLQAVYASPEIFWTRRS